MKHVAVATALAGAFGAVTAFGVAPIADADLPAPRHVTEPVVLSLQVPESIDQFLQTETIRRGDTMAALLERLGGSDPQFLRFAAADPVARKALQMRTGRTVQAEVDSLGRVLRFSYRTGGLEEIAEGEAPRPLKRVQIERDANDRLHATEVQIPIERVVEMRSVEIRSSLFAATDAAGIPEAVALKVADIFGGEIDFQRDLRKGDRLRVAYESVREAGSFDAPASSRILAIEFINNGKRHDAFWFERDGKGEYFDSVGQSLKKAFLRNPLEFTRITSGFTEARLHPIAREWRAHRGVDFAAPIGTGVRSAADGFVEFAGQQRGYGNVVIIKHRNNYSTVYAHLNGFAAGIKPGAKVGQGELIGTVGQTGWATGPHLHYELKISGEAIDPMTVAVSDARVLEGAERQTFAATVGSVRERLERIDHLRVARFQ